MNITVINKTTGLITLGPDLEAEYIEQKMKGDKIGKYIFQIGLGTRYEVNMKENYLYVENEGWIDENGYVEQGLSQILTRSIRG